MTFNFHEFTKSFGFPAPQKSSIVRTQVSDQIDLIYLSDLGKAGIHIRGLASMLNCDHSVIRRAIEGGAQEHVVELEMPTAGGLQVGHFILERGVVQVLKTIRRSNCAQATKDAAEELYDRFAEAGFKLYAMLEVEPEALIPEGYHKSPPEPDRFAEMRAQVELAIALAGGTGEPAVAAYKSLFHGVQEPKRSPGRPKKTPEPEPAPVAEVVENPILQPNAILADFLVKLNDLAQRDIVTDCSFTKIMKAYKPYLAVHLPTVWLLMVEHFAMQYDRVSLENAIISCHGYRRTLQRFVPKTGGEKKTQQRHCALIPMKSIDATSTARMLLESTIKADTAIPSSATQNAPMMP